MKRDPRAFLSDVIDAGRSIQQADSFVCRAEFTIMAEALSQLSRRDGGLFAQIDQAPQIISF